MNRLPRRTPGRANAAEQVHANYLRQNLVRLRATGRVRRAMFTEEPTPRRFVREGAGQVVQVGDVTLTPGTLLRLVEGDYFYAEQWQNPHTLWLTLTWIGEMAMIAEDRFVHVEGWQELGRGDRRARSVAVRVTALPEAVSRGSVSGNCGG